MSITASSIPILYMRIIIASFVKGLSWVKSCICFAILSAAELSDTHTNIPAPLSQSKVDKKHRNGFTILAMSSILAVAAGLLINPIPLGRFFTRLTAFLCAALSSLVSSRIFLIE